MCTGHCRLRYSRTHKYLSRSFRLKRFWAGGTSIWNRRTLLCGSHTPKGFWGWFHRLLGEYYEDYELVVWTNVTRFPLVTYRRKQHHHQMERNGFNRIFRFMSDRKDAVRYIHTRVKNGGESYIRHPETLETPEKRYQATKKQLADCHDSSIRFSYFIKKRKCSNMTDGRTIYSSTLAIKK